MLTTTLLAFLAIAPGLGLSAVVPVAVPVAVRGDTNPVILRQVQAQEPTEADLEATTNRLLFETSDEQFMIVRDARSQDYAMLDWSSDGCAPAKDKVMWWNFKAACMRRDFGVRNLQIQNRLPASLAHINDQFGLDLMTECRRHRFTKWLCKIKAKKSYLKPVLSGREPGTLMLGMSVAEMNATSPEELATEANTTPQDTGAEDPSSDDLSVES